jgi:LuxR family maltose regulon positive regulatory protein
MIEKGQNETHLERPHLEELLEKAIQSPIVTVTAGPGYGKTYSVYSFLRKCGARTVWHQVSELDNLEWRFWENFTEAAARTSEPVAVKLRELGFPGTSRSYDRFIALLRRELLPDKRYVVVYDDFHLIQKPPVLRFLERFAMAPIHNITLVFISQNEPAINTVSIMSKGFLSAITAEDLRFSKQEIDEYFFRNHIPMTPEKLNYIYQETEGAALTVSLIARNLREGGDERYTRSLMEINTFKSIANDLFGVIKEDLRKFLIKLSLIEHWSLDLLEQIAPDKALIGALNSIGSLIRYDTYRQSYRIQRLFIEFLREKQGELSGEEIREVYALTARWCLKNNLKTDAAINCERAEDYRGLIDIIYSFPRFMSAAVAAFFLEIVERIISRKDGEDEDFLFLRHVVQSGLLTILGRFDESTAKTWEAIKQFESLPSGAFRSRILTAAYNNLGTIGILEYLYTKDSSFVAYFERADYYFRQYPEVPKGPATQGNVASYANRVGYPAEKGDFERAIQLFIPALPYISDTTGGALFGIESLARCELAYFRGELNSAEQFARQAIYKAREKTQYEIENRAIAFLLRISLHQGSYSATEELLWQLRAQLEIPEFPNRYILYDIISGWFYTQIGQTRQLAPWLKNDFEESEVNTLLRGMQTLVRAKNLFVEKSYAAALSVITEEDAHGIGAYLLGKLEATVLEAACRYRLWEESSENGSENDAGSGVPREALRTLEDAYNIAVPEGLDMPFIELGEDMRLLADAALTGNSAIPRPWLETIRSKASAYWKKIDFVAEQYRNRERPAVELSIRETEVLSALSQGLTREEIAEESAITINAVKTVISSLYAKLGAINRADAVRIATSLGILKSEE